MLLQQVLSKETWGLLLFKGSKVAGMLREDHTDAENIQIWQWDQGLTDPCSVA